MFPQIPFGFLANTKITEAVVQFQIGSISTTTYIGLVREALSDLGIGNVSTKTDLQILRYAESLVQLKDINVQSSSSVVKEGSSTLNIGDVSTKTLLYKQDNLLWTPAQITTELWLDANDGSTIFTDTGLVTQWNDKSGNNRHASQSNSSNRPNLTTINGCTALNFNNNQWLATIGSDYSFQSYAIVFKCGGFVDPFDVYLSMRSSLSNLTPNSVTNFPLLLTHWDTTLDIFDNTAALDEANTYFDGSSIPLTSKTSPFNNTSRFFTVNTSEANIVYNDYPTSSGTGVKYLTIGTDVFGIWRAVTGQICEILLLPSVLTYSNRVKLEGYFAHKWGLTNKLPTDHPYKSTPPTI